MTQSPTLLRTEFHCHTIYSKDCLTSPKKLVEACRRKGIDRVVVTDHNSIEGALRCKEIDPDLVVLGEEIMTTDGELLVAYLREEIPPGLPPMEVITRLREQEAFISVSHPFDIYRSGHWDEENLWLVRKIFCHEFILSSGPCAYGRGRAVRDAYAIVGQS